MPSTFKPSPQQADFFNWIKVGNGSCILEAVAGSGKTTTLIEALKLMNGQIGFFAFNKKIAEEIKSRAPQKSGLDISTMHAAGFAAWRKVASNVKVDSNKCRDLYRRMFTPEFYPFESIVVGLVSLAKQYAIGVVNSAEDNSAWFDIIDHHNVDTMGSDDQVIQMSKSLLKNSIDFNSKIIDFDDMIYAPLVHGVKTKEYDWILIDEAQDLNVSRKCLALVMLKEGGRLVAVGDSRQAIYGWSGADANSMENIREAVNAISLPLSVSYRCPQNVVKEAQKYVSHIQAHESAIEGVVRTLKEEENIVKLAQPGDLIVSRFNKYLVEMVYQFIADGVPAKIIGRDVAAGIIALAKRWKVKTPTAFRNKLDEYRERETTKLRAQEKESQAAALEDKIKCLNIIINRVEKIKPNTKDIVYDVISEINNIFTDDGANKVVELSSIHKAKGREAETVYFLQTGSAKWARKDWEFLEEQNLLYVAITRAQKELIYVPIEK